MTHLWIVTHLHGSPSVDLLQSAATTAGGTVDIVRARHAHLDLTVDSNDLEARVVGFGAGISARPDAVITRLGASAPRQTHDLVRAIETAGLRCVNSAEAIARTTDKIQSFEHLRRHGLPLPRTLSLGSDAPLEEIEERLGPPPWILKLPVSFQGLGVARIDSMASLRSTVDLLRSREDRLIVQEFVREAAGSDVRVLVLGGCAVAAMRRQGAPDEFRSNIHRGGQGRPEEMTDLLAELAVSAATALGLEAAGVDILLAARGPLVIEVNASPGLAGIQRGTSLDLAARYIETALTPIRR